MPRAQYSSDSCITCSPPLFKWFLSLKLTFFSSSMAPINFHSKWYSLEWTKNKHSSPEFFVYYFRATINYCIIVTSFSDSFSFLDTEMNKLFKKLTIYRLTCFPLINQVMCGAGCAFDVVQFATKLSPIVNWRLLNVILGGPVCWTEISELNMKRSARYVLAGTRKEKKK